MKKFIGLVLSSISFLVLTVGAEATISIKVAEVQNGVAIIQGSKAIPSADITWEGIRVTQANRGGNFSFSGVIPADCVGVLSDGTPIEVAILNCTPIAEAPAPVMQTGQATSFMSRDDGALRRGVAPPSPRFTDNGDGTVRDNATGLVWLKKANCFGTRTWSQAFSDVANLADGQCGLTDGSRPGDWYLPNIRELLSLVHYGFFGPALSNASGSAQWTEGNAFTGVQSSYYWTSTTRSILTAEAWTVHFLEGLVFAGTETSPQDVLAVRSLP